MKVSAILPIFNEEKTLDPIVKILVNSDLVSEVICVNDGSTDDGLKILKSFNDQKILKTYWLQF